MTISSYYFNQDRLYLTLTTGETFNVATKKSFNDLFFPKFISSLFWAKISHDGNTFLVNRNSLAKRTKTAVSLVDYACDNHKNLDQVLPLLKKARGLTKSLKDHVYFQCRRQNYAAEFVEIIEKIKNKPIDGTTFAKIKKGHKILGHFNAETKNWDFYIQLATKLGRGAYKNVFTLLDYQKEKDNLAVSVQTQGSSCFSSPSLHRLDYLKNALLVPSSKNLMQPIAYMEKGIIRNPQDQLIADVEDIAEMFLVTKKYDGQLLKICQNCSLDEKMKIIIQILKGVSALHINQLVHCDLKSRNILVKKSKNGDFKVKIIDFDFLMTFSQRKMMTNHPGTRTHLPPEIYGDNPKIHPDKLDSWSLGILFYQLLEETPDFVHDLKYLDPDERLDAINQGMRALKFNHLTDTHPAKQVILSLLDLNPASRLSATEALRLLS